MKYFTKEELKDITKELIENPTRETLKKLNDKYNENNVVEDNLLESMTYNSDNTGDKQNATELKDVSAKEITNELDMKKEVVESEPLFESFPQLEITPMQNSGIQNIEAAKSEIPLFDVQNDVPVNLNNNLFVNSNPPIDNLNKTTENLNSVPNITPVTEIQVTPMPFFVTNPESVNNPIPVNSTNNSQVQSTSMFGQFEQNYM